MSRFTIGLIVVASLTLTAYFGAAAWHASDDRDTDITGALPQHGETADRSADRGLKLSAGL